MKRVLNIYERINLNWNSSNKRKSESVMNYYEVLQISESASEEVFISCKQQK